MSLSIFLAKLFGIYFVITGFATLLRHNDFLNALETFKDKISTLYPVVIFIGGVDIILGLLVVLTHNIWGTPWQAIISFMGWLALVEGILYMILPKDKISSLLGIFTRHSWIVAWGFASLAIGTYLVSVGFAF